MSAPLDPTDLVGSWELLRCEISFSDGRPTVLPYGADARGQLVYAADGRVSAVLSRGDRGPLGVAGLESAAAADASAKAAAFDSYLSYAGRWRLDGDRVIHTVELALVPEVVGRDQVRRVAFDGDQLVLGYERTARSGVERRYRLTWRRVSS